MSVVQSSNQPRTAIITGGGSGIGRAITHVFAERGVNCVIAGRRLEPLVETQDELVDAPGAIKWVQADVATAAGRQQVVRACTETFGVSNVLVNNAGITATASLLDYDEDSWRTVFSTNVEAAFFLAQLVIPGMRDSGWGRIVNIGSVYGSLGINNDYYEGRLPWDTPGDRGPVREVAYAASKGAILQLTRELATAVGRWNITVNTVTPGMIPVDAIPMAVSIRDRLSKMTPLGRVGRPEDIAPAVFFLATPAASFITGAELKVDGGWSIW